MPETIMTKKRRIALIILASFVIFCVLFLTIAPMTLDTTDYRRSVGEWLSKRLNRTVTIGDLSFRAITGPKIIIHDLTVSDNPAFSRDPFLTAREVVISLRIIPLLKGRFVIRGIAIKQPLISIIEKEDTSLNIATLTPPGVYTPRVSVLLTRLFAIPVPTITDTRPVMKHVDISNGILTYTRLDKDGRTEEVLRFKGLDVRIKNIKEADLSKKYRNNNFFIPFSGDVSISIATGIIRNFVLDNIDISGVIDDTSLIVDKMSTEIFGGKLSANGYFKPTPLNYELVINLTLSDIMANKLLSIVRQGEDSCFGVLNLEGTLTAKGKTLDAMLDNFSGDALISIEDGHIPSFNIRTELTALGLIEKLTTNDMLDTSFSIIAGSFTLSGDRIITPKLAFKSDEWDAIAKGEITLSGVIDFSGDILLANSMALNIKPEYIIPLLHDQTGKLSLPFNISGNVDAPQFLLRPEFLTEKDAGEIFDEFKHEISEKYKEGYSIKFINRITF
jgi:uncharacterized protein involved in outer membrane biogenesis